MVLICVKEYSQELKKGGWVKGVLDYCVMCNRITSLTTGKEEGRTTPKKNPTNITQLQKGWKAVDSNHLPLELTLEFTKCFSTNDPVHIQSEKREKRCRSKL